MAIEEQNLFPAMEVRIIGSHYVDGKVGTYAFQVRDDTTSGWLTTGYVDPAGMGPWACAAAIGRHVMAMMAS